MIKVGINKADQPGHGTIMDAMTIQIISVVAILGFLWNLHRDVSNLRQGSPVSQDIAGLRKDVGQDIADLRKDVGQDIADLRKDVGQDIADLRERMARMEGLLGGYVGRPRGFYSPDGTARRRGGAAGRVSARQGHPKA